MGSNVIAIATFIINVVIVVTIITFLLITICLKAFDIQFKGERLDLIGRAICNPYFYHSMVFLINNAKNYHLCAVSLRQLYGVSP